MGLDPHRQKLLLDRELGKATALLLSGAVKADGVLGVDRGHQLSWPAWLTSPGHCPRKPQDREACPCSCRPALLPSCSYPADSGVSVEEDTSHSHPWKAFGHLGLHGWHAAA